MSRSCHICLNPEDTDEEDFFTSCEDPDHLVCSSCMEDWMEPYQSMLIFPCPVCRCPCYKDLLNQCGSCRLVPSETKEVVDGPAPSIFHEAGISQLFRRLSGYLKENPQVFSKIYMNCITVQFFGKDVEYDMTRDIINGPFAEDFYEGNLDDLLYEIDIDEMVAEQREEDKRWQEEEEKRWQEESYREYLEDLCQEMTRF